MKTNSGRGRKPSQLSNSLHQQLNLYALAASAAGVSAIAMAQPAEAKVVYTKTHVVIPPGHTYKLDLNQDKVVDFTIANFESCTYFCGYFLQAQPTRGNGAVGFSQRFLTYASALKSGVHVGAGKNFRTLSANMVIHTSNFTGGPWVNVTDRYLGLDFKANGEIHYGWARLNVRVSGSHISATLTGYAYETIANKAITTGATEDSQSGIDVNQCIPTTLEKLALGKN